MQVLLIGCGFIGSALAIAMEEIESIETIYVTDKSSDRGSFISSCRKAKYVEEVGDVLEDVDLVVEAASQQAVEQYAPSVLEKGKDILIMSVGALADDELRERCTKLAGRNKCRILIPTGALSGIDGLNSASMGELREVSLTSTKPVKALEGNEYLRQNGIDLDGLKSAKEVFHGSAREAARNFPKTSNVAATLSLAGMGFDRTKVTIIADPDARRNTHKITAIGDFGELNATASNVPSPENPKTSLLAALSAISGLKKLTGIVWVGL
jgi:aspartate dehydrogenase